MHFLTMRLDALPKGMSHSTDSIFCLYETHMCETWGEIPSELGVQPPSQPSNPILVLKDKAVGFGL